MIKDEPKLQQGDDDIARVLADDNKALSGYEMRRLLDRGRELQRVLEPRLRAMKGWAL